MKNKKKRIGLKILACVISAALVGSAVWQIAVRVKSSKYNLITLDTSELPAPQKMPDEDSFIQLSDVKMHYTVYGKDSGKKPFILLHGNAGSLASLDEAAEYLSNDFTVYSLESRCHGQSSDPGEISYRLMAADAVEFIKAMGIEKPYIMGHSDGGITALTIASMFPDVPGGIISCGANSAPEKFKPYFTIGVAIANLFHPDKLNDMMLELPDFTEAELKGITCPTYIVAAEYDIMWLSDTVYLHNCVPGSDIAIIKLGNHSSYMSHDGGQAYVLAKGWTAGIENK